MENALLVIKMGIFLSKKRVTGFKQFGIDFFLKPL